MTQLRASSLSPQDMLLLRNWGQDLFRAFGETPYLVGSAARAESYRDVDVRLMMDDDQFALLTGNTQRLDALNLAFTLWGRMVTGLPIDFQFQDTTTTNDEHNGIRNALAHYAVSQ